MIEAARKSTDSLAAVVAIQRQFIADANPCAAFDRALELLLELSESKFGVIGEVQQWNGGQPYLKIQSYRGIDADNSDALRDEAQGRDGLEFCGISALISEAIRTGEFVISNAPEIDPRSTGLPSGHPPLDSFLGMPLFSATGVQVGLIGLANRVPGYDGELIVLLQPICDALGVMIDAAHRGRKRLADEAALKAEESRYRSFVDQATDGIFLHDRTGRVLDVNRQACESLGYERVDLIGMLPFAFDPAVTQEHIEEIARRLDNGETFAFESVHRRKDGSTFPVEIRVRPFWVNETRQSLAIARDITERKQAEMCLRESEARLRTVLQNLDQIAVQAYEPDGTITFWNKASELFYGYSAQEAIGRDIVELLHSDATRDQERSIMAEALSGNGHIVADEVEVVRCDGSRFTVLASRIVHRRPGQPAEFFCFDVDITERKRAEVALKESEQRARLALDVAHLGTWRHELAEDLVYFDSRAQAFWGFGAPTISGDEARRRIHPDDRQRILGQWQRVVELGSEEILCSEFRILEPDGTVRWLSVRGRLVFETDGDRRIALRSIGTYLDVTERKVIELERERLHQEILASREQIREMSRRVIQAHETERRDLALELHDEIGQVLTTVNLSLESLRSRIDPAYLYRLDEGSRVVSQAIEQVRDLSLNLRPASLDLLGLDAALRAYAQRQAARANLTFDLKSNLHGLRLPPTLETVCFRIAQEALTNVIRHASARHCWIRLELRHGEVEITVNDDGIGFDTALLSERAARGESFGLLGMLERVQLFEGTIEFDSHPGCGTMLKALVPLRSMPS